MKYLLSQLLVLVMSVIFLIYLASLEYFLPYTSSGEANWYNIVMVLVLVLFAVEAIASLVVYLGQKFIAYGWKEFPDYKSSLKWGIVVSLLFSISLFLHIFHIINFAWGLGVAVLIVIVLVLLGI